MPRQLFTLFLVIFIDLLGFGVIIPILPLYAQNFGANGFLIGLLMASYSAVQFLLSPIWGRVSDRYGRRPVLLSTIFGTIFSLLLLGFAKSFLWLLIGRVLAGIFAANISTAYAYVSDITTNESRAKGMGLMGAAMGLGFTLGPAIGGFFAEYGFGVPMFFSAGLAVLNFIFAYFSLTETVHRSDRNREKMSFQRMFEVLKVKKVGIPIFAFFLMSLANTQMEVIMVIYLFAIFGLSVKTCGMLFAMVGLIMVFVQGSLIGPLSKRYSERGLILFSSALGAAAFFFFGLNQTLLGLAVVTMGFMAISRGILFPSLTTLTSKGAEDHERGGTMGLMHSSGSLARVIGPLIAGTLYDQTGKSSPFFAGALFLCLIVFGAFFSTTPLGVQSQNQSEA